MNSFIQNLYKELRTFYLWRRLVIQKQNEKLDPILYGLLWIVWIKYIVH